MKNLAHGRARAARRDFMLIILATFQGFAAASFSSKTDKTSVCEGVMIQRASRPSRSRRNYTPPPSARPAFTFVDLTREPPRTLYDSRDLYSGSKPRRPDSRWRQLSDALSFEAQYA